MMHLLRHTLRLALVCCAVWGNSFAGHAACKATTPPPLRTASPIESVASLDTLAYLAGANVAMALQTQVSTLGIRAEHYPTAIAGFRQYWKERSDVRRLAYNTGIMLVPHLVDMLTKAQDHAFGTDTTKQLSLPHFAQGIEEGMQGINPTAVPDSELEVWVDGQLSNLRYNYSAERAEQVSYALGQVAAKGGYIAQLMTGFDADTLHTADAIAGITQGLRATQPHQIAHYTGLNLGHQAWQGFASMEQLIGQKLSHSRYLEGVADAAQGQLQLTDATGALLTPDAAKEALLTRLETYYYQRYQEALMQASNRWDALNEDTTLTWLSESVAYRIDSEGTGALPTPNQRIKGSVATYTIEGDTIASDTSGETWQKALRGSGTRLRSIDEPLRSVLQKLPTGTAFTLYYNQTSRFEAEAQEKLATIPTLIVVYRISTATQSNSTTAVRKTTTVRKATPRKATPAKRKTATRRR